MRLGCILFTGRCGSPSGKTVGLAIAVVAFSVILLRRESRTSRVARTGAMWSPMVASLIWVTGIDPMMELYEVATAGRLRSVREEPTG